MVYTTPEILASYHVGALLGTAIGFSSCKPTDGDTKDDNHSC